MKFKETSLKGAYIIDLEKMADERGFFARSFCRREFEHHGLNPGVVQCNISFNLHKGTLRGMHYQEPPFAEVKMVRCIRGAVHDVIVDMRQDSPTYLRWLGMDLSSENGIMLYVPEGFAHGYQTLTDESEILYMVTQFYAPAHERGMRWNDPLLGIEWPIAEPILSEKDAKHPDFKAC